MARPSRRIPSPFYESPRRRRLARFLAAATPDEVRGCFVPFLGGGATAIGLLQRHPEGWFGLSSPDGEMVTVWESVRDDVDRVIEEIRALAEGHDPSRFAAVRDRTDAELERMPRTARAARAVYLRAVACPDASGEPPLDLAAAQYGRDVVAHDEAGLRELARLLQTRDVAISRRGLFEVLADVGESDLVVLDPSAGAVTARELRSFVAAVTAKGAGVLAAGLGEGFYAGWPGFVRLDDSPEDETIWANTVLQRARAGGIPRAW